MLSFCVGFIYSTHEFLNKFHENWVMITSPTVSVLKNSTNPAWESGSSGEKGADKISHRSVHNSVSPTDPSRQASRLPIKVLKMLTARAGHLLHPEYLQPLPSTPVSPIEVSITMKFWRILRITDIGSFHMKVVCFINKLLFIDKMKVQIWVTK